MTSIKENYGNSPWYLPLEDTVASVSVLGKMVFLRENMPALAYRALPASKHGFGQNPSFLHGFPILSGQLQALHQGSLRSVGLSSSEKKGLEGDTSKCSSGAGGS